MKFLYLIKRPLTPRDWYRYGVNFMLELGHSVTVLDLSEVIYPSLDHGYAGVAGDDRVDIREIASWAQFEGQRQAFIDCDMVIFLIQSFGLSGSTYRPLRMIAKTGVPYLILAPTLLPGWHGRATTYSLVDIAADIWARIRNMNLLNSLILRLPPSWLGIKTASYIVYPSFAEEYSNRLVGPNTRSIKAHAFDYEIYLDELNCDPKPLDRAVFLDQFWPYHPENEVSIHGPIDDKKYFSGLRRVFDRIESELGLEVVIAAHPSGDYDNRPGLFGDRQVIYGQTVHIVATSRLVLTHLSTAIGFAVLFEKPIMIITNKDTYNWSDSNRHIFKALPSELGTPLRFFNNPETMDMSDAYAINHELYDRYKENYLKCADSPQESFWKIVLENINQGTNPKNE